MWALNPNSGTNLQLYINTMKTPTQGEWVMGGEVIDGGLMGQVLDHPQDLKRA